MITVTAAMARTPSSTKAATFGFTRNPLIAEGARLSGF